MKQLMLDNTAYLENPSNESANHELIHPAKVTEIIITTSKADAEAMLLPMLAHFNEGQRWVAWIDPPVQMLKDWQNRQGHASTENIMVLRSDSKKSAIALSEQALSAGTSDAVIVWSQGLSGGELKRLEQASSKGQSHCIVLRERA